MTWEGKYTDEFGRWWESLRAEEQDFVDAGVGLLEQRGPQLGFPYSSGIATSRHSHMREIRIQHRGEPYRLLYEFDRRRVALLLIGGSKIGDDRWYERFVPKADALYDEHRKQLKAEGVHDGQEF